MALPGCALFRSTRAPARLADFTAACHFAFCRWSSPFPTPKAIFRERPVSATPVVEVENVSMAYRMYAKPTDMLAEVLLGRVRHETFWAIRDIDMTIKEGERVGIIGPN